MKIHKKDYGVGVCTECGSQFIPTIKAQKICLKAACKKSRNKKRVDAYREKERAKTASTDKRNERQKRIDSENRDKDIRNMFLKMPLRKVSVS